MAQELLSYARRKARNSGSSPMITPGYCGWRWHGRTYCAPLVDETFHGLDAALQRRTHGRLGPAVKIDAENYLIMREDDILGIIG
jgi:hypothetical protein